MAYKLTEAAEEDVIHLLAEGGRQFGLRQAHAYYAELLECFVFLAENPRAARERTDLSPVVRIHPYGSHVIIYQITVDDDVLILAVRHARENWQDDL
ncbi:MAG TPA: type II toxin-antitoxin system RelE/ParE family toxin [Asticcacaulis sp.]